MIAWALVIGGSSAHWLAAAKIRKRLGLDTGNPDAKVPIRNMNAHCTVVLRLVLLVRLGWVSIATGIGIFVLRLILT